MDMIYRTGWPTAATLAAAARALPAPAVLDVIGTRYGAGLDHPKALRWATTVAAQFDLHTMAALTDDALGLVRAQLAHEVATSVQHHEVDWSWTVF